MIHKNVINYDGKSSINLLDDKVKNECQKG